MIKLMVYFAVGTALLVLHCRNKPDRFMPPLGAPVFIALWPLWLVSVCCKAVDDYFHTQKCECTVCAAQRDFG